MKKLIIICIVLFGCVQLQGQSLERTVIGSAGIAIQNSSGGLSFTVGELATNASNLLTQGFQQPTIKKNVGTVNVQNMNAEAIVFPNPTVDVLNIKSALPTVGIDNVSYKIVDNYGKTVLQGTIASNGGMIDVKSLASASYVLVLSSGTDFSQKVRFTRI